MFTMGKAKSWFCRENSRIQDSHQEPQHDGLTDRLTDRLGGRSSLDIPAGCVHATLSCSFCLLLVGLLQLSLLDIEPMIW